MSDSTTINKLFTIPKNGVNDANFAEAMKQAISLELATIPTYLSTYYSINRVPNQEEIYNKILANIPADLNQDASKIAEELSVDVMVYANKTAALIMSVVIEEMLHLSLSSNVNQSMIGPPNLMGIIPNLTFPTQLDGHQPEFPINLGKLSMQQLKTFLQIESPNAFTVGTPEVVRAVKYTTIGEFYDMIVNYIQNDYKGTFDSKRPQLTPDQPFYSQNSINTVYYDRQHNPHFVSEDDSGDLTKVIDVPTAVHAMKEIIHQGEGHTGGTQLTFDSKGMPVPLPVVNGEVQFKPEDYDDPDKKELSHFGKFLEAYSLGGHYITKFQQYNIDFFDLFVFNQLDNAKLTDFASNEEVQLVAELANAIYSYIILMIDTCYHADTSTQFKVFMYGIHKSMIWLLSELGNGIRKHTFTKNGVTYNGSLSFESYTFKPASAGSPKAQIIALATTLGTKYPNWNWLTNDKAYLDALPDVSLDYVMTPNVPAIPQS